jgi:hypothetical protein
LIVRSVSTAAGGGQQYYPDTGSPAFDSRSTKPFISIYPAPAEDKFNRGKSSGFDCNPRLRILLDKKSHHCRQKNGEYLVSLTIL